MMTATKTIYFVREGFGGEHGPFSSQQRAEEFAIALAQGGKVRGTITITSRTIDVDDED